MSIGYILNDFAAVHRSLNFVYENQVGCCLKQGMDGEIDFARRKLRAQNFN